MIKLTKSLMLFLIILPIIVFSYNKIDNGILPHSGTKCYVKCMEYDEESGENEIFDHIAYYIFGSWLESTSGEVLENVIDWTFLEIVAPEVLQEAIYSYNKDKKDESVHTDGPTAPAAIPNFPNDTELSAKPICASSQDTDSPRHFST